MSKYTDISYVDTIYSADSSLNLKDFDVKEDWYNRPATEWSVKRIGRLQAKIEQYTYQIYHRNSYGKVNMSRLIPAHVLISFANECFGYDGWNIEIEHIETLEHIEKSGTETENEKVMHTVMAESRVKLILKDNTYTFSGGFGKATMQSKGDAFAKAKKEAINDALKKCLLGFEQVIIDHEVKVKSNYYVDGVYRADLANESKENDGMLAKHVI